MSIEIKIPELGENVTGGTVANVLVKKGETVQKDQPIVELETEKAVLEVPADQGGRVQEVLVKAGDQVLVGQAIIVLDGNGEAKTKAPVQKVVEVETPKAEKSEPKVEPKPAPKFEPTMPRKTGGIVDVAVPELGENVAGGTVANVLVRIGDQIAKDQSIVELETEKAVLEVPSSVAGTVKEILIKNGDTVKIAQVLIRVESGETTVVQPAVVADKKPAAAPIAQPAAQAPKPGTPEPVMAAPAAVTFVARPAGVPAAAAPSVRRFAREIGVDINEIKGTGPGGRISIEDVKAFSKQRHLERATAPAGFAGIAAAPLPDFSKWGAVERQVMSQVREKTAAHLAGAWATIPHVTQFDKADITELETLRKQYSDKAEKAGGKLTMTAILLKVLSSAVKVFPQFNASVDMAKKEIIYKKYINIGVAVDTDRGLLVPVVKNVDKKNLIELAVELTELAAKARDKKLTLEEMSGGNITISNLGGIGGTYFTPIINAPDVAILGVSRGAFEPVYIDGQFVPRLKLPLSLSYDHRIIDGADGIRFLRWVVEALEQPFTMILEG